MPLKDSSYMELWRPFSAILVDGIKRNNSAKLFQIWASGSGDVVLKIYLQLLRPPVQ